jgi:hypothetical protein
MPEHENSGVFGAAMIAKSYRQFDRMTISQNSVQIPDVVSVGKSASAK